MPDKDVPITQNTILRWSGFVAAAVTGIVTLVMGYSNLSSRLDLLQQKQLATDTYLNDRRTVNEKRFQRLEDRADQSDKTMSDVQRKLDVVVAILQRIDSRTNAEHDGK